MEVVQPQPLPLSLPSPQSEVKVWERKKAREYEDIDDGSVSVPKEISSSDVNFDGFRGDVLRLPRKANYEDEDEDEDEYEDEDDEDEDDEDGDEDDDDDGVDRDALWAKYLKEGITNLFYSGDPVRLPPCIDDDDDYPPGGRLCENSIIRSIDDIDNWPDDDSEEEVLVPPPTLRRAGLCFMKADDESCEASLRRDVECALKEYKRREGVDYEYVKAVALHMTSPPESEPDPDRHGKHTNFFAKREGSDSCPDFFFASLSSQGVHCCKLNYDPTVRTIQHCEHTKCFECHLWTYRKKN